MRASACSMITLRTKRYIIESRFVIFDPSSIPAADSFSSHGFSTTFVVKNIVAESIGHQ